jgi:hypothetical protein
MALSSQPEEGIQRLSRIQQFRAWLYMRSYHRMSPGEQAAARRDLAIRLVAVTASAGYFSKAGNKRAVAAALRDANYWQVLADCVAPHSMRATANNAHENIVSPAVPAKRPAAKKRSGRT